MANLSKLFEMLVAKLHHWMEIIVLSLPNAAVALLVVVLTVWLTRPLRGAAVKVLGRAIHNDGLVELLATAIRVIAVCLGLIVALNVLSLDRAVLSLLTGVGVVGLALGFAFQDMAANLISGVALVVRSDKPFKVGDLIETGDLRAFVTEINLRDTELRTFDGQAVFIPNSSIFKNQLTNFSLLGSRRVAIDVGVSYGDDLEKARRVLLDVVNSLDDLHPDHAPDVNFTGFGDSSINAVVRFWVAYPPVDVVAAKSAAIIAIKRAFDAHDLSIPFPIRTLDFDIRGGMTLPEALAASRGPNGAEKAAPATPARPAGVANGVTS
jgi:small conductance mechanosensitive channel